MWRTIIFIALWSPLIVLSQTQKKEIKPYSDIRVQKCELKCSDYHDIYQKYQSKKKKHNNAHLDREERQIIHFYYQYSR